MSDGHEPNLFHGREGRTNQAVLRLLVHGNLTKYQISRRLRKAYSTIFDRLKDLRNSGIIEERGKTRAKKSQNDLSLWGLTSYGLCCVALQEDDPETRNLALIECQRRLSRWWNTFWKLYDFDLVKGHKSKYNFIKNWLESDEGIIETLQTFGHTILESESYALIAYRQMLDIGVILVQSDDDFILVGKGTPRQSANFAHALTYLARIALEHPVLRKLHEAAREVDGPLYRHIKAEEFEKTVARLSKSCPPNVARKLAMTPFFRKYPVGLMKLTEAHFVDEPLQEVISQQVEAVKEAVRWENRKNFALRNSKRASVTSVQVSHHPSIQKVIFEPHRYDIVTNDPAEISAEWLRNSAEVYVIDHQGHVAHRKGSELVK